MYKLKNKFNDFVVSEFQKKDHFWVTNISMETHYQMTLILRNLKFILFLYSFSKYYCLCHLQELQLIFHNCLTVKFVLFLK